METPAYMPSPYPTGPTTMPMPPRLHWGWVLALSLLTRNFFGVIWLVVQAVWVYRVTGRTAPRNWAIAHLCAFPLVFVGSLLVGAVSARSGLDAEAFRRVLLAVSSVSGLTIAVLYIATVFKLRAALENEPILIPLGGVMTFFFGPLYFQYFLRDWVPMEYSTAALYPQYTYPSVPPQA